MSWPIFHRISSELFRDNSKLCLGRNSVASHRHFSKTIPNGVLAENQLHLIGIILRQFQIVSHPKFKYTSSKLFWDNAKLCLSTNSIASRRNFSNTIPNCFLSGSPSRLIEFIRRQFQMVSRSKFHWISSIIF